MGAFNDEFYLKIITKAGDAFFFFCPVFCFGRPNSSDPHVTIFACIHDCKTADRVFLTRSAAL